MSDPSITIYALITCLGVAAVISLILLLSLFKQMARIKRLRDEKRKLEENLETTSRKIHNVQRSLQTIEKDIKGLQKNLAE